MHRSILDYRKETIKNLLLTCSVNISCVKIDFILDSALAFTALCKHKT